MMDAWGNPRRRGLEARLSPWESWVRWQKAFREAARRYGRVTMLEARQAAADGLVDLSPKDAWRAGITPSAHARAVAEAVRTAEEIEQAREEYYERRTGTFQDRYNEALDMALPLVGIGPSDVPQELREYGYRSRFPAEHFAQALSRFLERVGC